MSAIYQMRESGERRKCGNLPSVPNLLHFFYTLQCSAPSGIPCDELDYNAVSFCG